MDIKKLITRALSGLIYVAVIVGCVVWGEPGISLLGIAFAILAGLELRNILNHDKSSSGSFLFSFLDILGIALISVTFNARIPFIPILLWVVVVIVRFVAQLYDKVSNPVKELSHSMFAQIYLGLPLAAMGMASFLFSPYLVLTVFLMLWINDTGAYLVGSMIGKRKLFERISPNKSWEGFYGGLVFNIVTAILFGLYSPGFTGVNLSVELWIGLAIIVTVFGTWGDLVESMMKRNLNIKDSGHLIPGHGGILDRIDSFLIAMPAAVIYIIVYSLFF